MGKDAISDRLRSSSTILTVVLDTEIGLFATGVVGGGEDESTLADAVLTSSKDRRVRESIT